ncbi:hypothetical protein BpHYR1_030456 [Brachionus plicatilis]|uniref:Uncharacterized protein n=1 Tax=Brachionus plicatilis TaxID=10195 RepID=A0A3M7QUQ3_BRAPC|nr:hypothetical protein BpHYR1_030456 [Brachionus plicatilis]
MIKFSKICEHYDVACKISLLSPNSKSYVNRLEQVKERTYTILNLLSISKRIFISDTKSKLSIFELAITQPETRS